MRILNNIFVVLKYKSTTFKRSGYDDLNGSSMMILA